eukprot:COSAG01_NODE_44155_length_422_cov_0.634675_1_plen_95_part_01
MMIMMMMMSEIRTVKYIAQRLTSFGGAELVWGLDFTPDPHGAERGPGLGRTYRLYCESQADRAWLRRALELQVLFVELWHQEGQQPRSEGRFFY